MASGNIGDHFRSRNLIVDMETQLSRMQLLKLRDLLGSGAHPDRIDAFLRECGSEPDDVLNELNVRRKDIIYWYRARRKVRVLGAVLIFLSGAPTLLMLLPGVGPGVAVVCLGILSYGIALVYTGDLKVFSTERQIID